MFQHLLLIKIPCFIGTNESDPVFEVVVFSDASMKSYVYLRVVTHSGAHVNLVFSKMRLALIGRILMLLVKLHCKCKIKL